MSDPLHQFEVKQLIPININGIDLSFTNASLFMVLSVMCGLGMMWLLIRRQLLIPNTTQSVGEAIFGFIHTTARDCIGDGYEKFFPFILSVFLMVFFGNFLGLFPYSFTFTSQLAPVGAFALLGTVISVVVGINRGAIVDIIIIEINFGSGNFCKCLKSICCGMCAINVYCSCINNLRLNILC